MDALQISIAIGFLIFLGVLLALLGIAKRRLNLDRRLNQGADVEEPSAIAGVTKQVERALVSMGERLPRSPAEMSRQERKLVQAGYRRKDAVMLLNGSHIAVILVLLLIFAATGYLYRQPIISLTMSLLLGAALPDLWLRRAIRQRQEELQFALPDAMDLAVIAVEAGLGLDQALLRVGDEINVAHPALADELRLRNLEINMGRSRTDALRNFAERTGVEDLKALVAILIQTDRFGTSVGQALRTFSDSLRVKRRQRAEEQAAKLAIKMVVPMVLFIFPGVFIVILGPAFIAIIRDLLPTLSGTK
ncbi:MAG TPA: type II secretion system F family protein [Terriglobia bacterium]|nr:type II secretion system F family protein [Terriglobia bacterium]